MFGIIALLIGGYILISFGVITFACMFSSRMSYDRLEFENQDETFPSIEEKDTPYRRVMSAHASRFSATNVRFIE